MTLPGWLDAYAALDDDAHHDAIVAGVHAQRAVLVDLDRALDTFERHH